jgi:N-methylhydantoinase A/oxoprolinase/acetone carboxylase beta subunit
LGFRSLFKEIREGKENLANKIKEEVTRKSAREIITYLINREYKNYEEDKCKVCEELLKLSLANHFEEFNLDFKSKLPLISIGAPAKAYLDELFKYLNTEIILPDNYEVANAIGAAVGSILVNEEVLIKPNSTKGNYTVHSSKVKEEFIELDEAIDYAKEIARELAIQKAEAAGAKKWELDLKVEEKEIELSKNFGGTLLEVKIEAIVVGTP